jgi:hypothetical protein
MSPSREAKHAKTVLIHLSAAALESAAEPEVSKSSATLFTRLRSWLGIVLGAVVLAVMIPVSAAYADSLPNLPQNAGGYEQSFSPAYDYDVNGCYAVSAIAPDGTLNPGLGLGGAVNGHCHDQVDLDRSQTYARSKCNNGWCAVAYASYFEKDQSSDGVGEIAGGANGHRHDWEHVIAWINQSSNQVEYVSTTVHDSVRTYPRSQVRFNGSHPKVGLPQGGRIDALLPACERQ